MCEYFITILLKYFEFLYAIIPNRHMKNVFGSRPTIYGLPNWLFIHRDDN